MPDKRSYLAFLAMTAALATFACTHTSSPATGASAPVRQGAAADAGARAGAGRGGDGRGGDGRGGEAGGRGGPGGGRQRRPPNYEAQDSVRRATVAEILREVAGREHEPAGRVFKNVKLLKDVPVDEFLKTMDETYGRGLGYTCTSCHVDKDFANDSKKGKIIGRQMQAMTIAINRQYLGRIKEMDDDYQRTTCVSCHKSTEKVNNKMTQPTNAPN